MKKTFIEFLQLNGAYEAYKENAWNDHHARFEEKNNQGDIYGISIRQPAEKWVSCAFDWEQTPQGHDYWLRINQLWIHSLKSM